MNEPEYPTEDKRTPGKGPGGWDREGFHIGNRAAFVAAGVALVTAVTASPAVALVAGHCRPDHFIR